MDRLLLPPSPPPMLRLLLSPSDLCPGAFPRTRSLVRGAHCRCRRNARVVANFETNAPLKPPAERDAPTTPRLEGGKENRKRRSKKKKEKQSSNKYRSGTKQTGEMNETACLASLECRSLSRPFISHIRLALLHSTKGDLARARDFPPSARRLLVPAQDARSVRHIPQTPRPGQRRVLG